MACRPIPDTVSQKMLPQMIATMARLRKARGLTYQQLSACMTPRGSFSVLSGIETGKKAATINLMIEILEALGAEVELVIKTDEVKS